MEKSHGLYSLFAAPPERDLDWQQEGVSGISRFLARAFRYVTRNCSTNDLAAGEADADRAVLRKLHQAVAKITNDFDSRWHFNTSIASLMELVNELYAHEAKLSSAVAHTACNTLTRLLAPFAPYTAQELWETLGNAKPVFREAWPEFDPELAKEDLPRDAKGLNELAWPLADPDPRKIMFGGEVKALVLANSRSRAPRRSMNIAITSGSKEATKRNAAI